MTLLLHLWLARWLDGLSRRHQRIADDCDRRAAKQWRAYNGAQARRAAATEQRRAIERVIAESRTPSARISRVGSPIHRDR